MQGRKQGTQSLGSFRVRKLYGEQSQYSWQSAGLPADPKETGDEFSTLKSLQDDKMFPWTAPHRWQKCSHPYCNFGSTN